jgi:hypothetical protein
MLKNSYILDSTSFSSSDYARDLTQAAAAGADPLHQKDIAVLTEGFFKNLADTIIDYNALLPEGDPNKSMLLVKQQLEKIADEVEGEALVTNRLPATAADIPHDKQGLGSLLLPIRNNEVPASMFPTKGDFSIDKVWNLLYPTAPAEAMPATEQAAVPAAAAEEAKPEVTDMSAGQGDEGSKHASWMFKASADEAVAVEQAREMMVNSGYFSEEQRSESFNQKLNDILMQTQANIDDEITRRSIEHAGRAEMREKKQDDAQAEEARQKGINGDVDLNSLSPATRKKLEDAQAAAAKVSAEDDARAVSKQQRRQEFTDTADIPTAAIPGINQFIREMQLIMTPESNEPEDLMLHESLKKYFAELKQATAADPDNWRGPATDLMQQHPDLLERADVVAILAKLHRDEQDIRKEERPGRGPEKEIPARQRASLRMDAGLIMKNQEYDATKGQGPWELDIEAKAIRRRKVMVANAMLGRPPVPFALGDVVGFDRGSSITSGKILAIAAADYILETAKGVVKVNHEAVFEPSATDLF